MIFSGTPPSFDQLLTRGAAVVLGAALVWAFVVLVAVLVEAVTAGRIRFALALGCPHAAHRWLLAVVGAALSATVLVPAAAQASTPDVPRTTVLDGLPLPDRTIGGPLVAPVVAPSPATGPATGPAPVRGTNSFPQPRARTPTSVSSWVTVRAGDSLWAISRSLLPPTASPLRIAQHAHQLHVHNRRTIGADPDQIRPGQRLAVPQPAHEAHSEDS